MADIDVRIPDGRLIRVVGAESDEAARAAVRSMLQEERREAPRTGSSFSRGIDELQGNLFSAVEGLGRSTGLGFLENLGRSGRERNEREAEAAMPSAQRQTFEDAETLGDYVRAAGQAIGSNVPNSALSMGAGLAGGKIGAAIGAAGGPAGIAAGSTIGFLLGSLAANYPQIFGSHRQRQMQENPDRPVDEAAAALTAIPSTALDTVSDRIMMGLGRALGVPTQEVGRTLLPRIARGLGIGAATEVPTEVLQQALERAQAGLDVLSPDAMREYLETTQAAAASGGATGSVISGAFGRRPDGPTSPPPTNQPEAAPGFPYEPIATPMPEEPAPIETVDEARLVLEANPEFAAPVGTTDEGLIARANDVLRATYRDQVSGIRRQTLAEWLGANNFITRPGELDPDGNPTDDTIDVGRAAPILIRNILDARGRGELETGQFTANQIADIAMARLGLTHSSMSKRDREFLSNSLRAYQEAGYLEKAGRNTFTLAARPETRSVGERRDQQANPRTAEERAVNGVLSALDAVVNNPTAENIQAAAAAARGTQLEGATQRFLAGNLRLRQLQQQRRQLAQTPENTNAFKIIEAEEQTIAADMTNAINELEGRSAGTIMASGQESSPAGYAGGIPVAELPSEAAFSAQVGRSAPAVFSQWQALIDAQKAQQQAAQIVANDNDMMAELIRSRPQEALALVESLLEGRAPGSRFDNQAIRQAAATQEIELNSQIAALLYDVARANNLINSLGLIPKTGTSTRPNIRQTGPATTPIGGPPAERTRAQQEVAGIERDEPTTREKIRRVAERMRPKTDFTEDQTTGAPADNGEPNARLDDERPTDDNDNVNFIRRMGEPETPTDKEAARVAGERAYRRVLGRNGRLEIRDKIMLADLSQAVRDAAEKAGISLNENVTGVAEGDLAILALGGHNMPIQDVAIHEGLHVAENIGVITPTEIAFLNSQADKIRAVIRKYYPNVTDADMANLREVRAFGLNARVAQRTDFGSGINAIYDKFVNFLNRIANFVRGQGFQTWRDVYDAFYAGEMAHREATRVAQYVANKKSGDTVSNVRRDLADTTSDSDPWYQYVGDLKAGGTLAIRFYVQPDTGVIEITGIDVKNADNNPHLYTNEIAGLSTENDPFGKGVRIGPGELRKTLRTILNDIRKDYPNVNSVVAERVTGARAGNQNQFMQMRVPVNFMRAPAKVERDNVDRITGPLRWFGSPVMTIGKVRPELRDAGDTMLSLYTRSNEMINEVEPMLEGAHRLPPASVARITRVWEQASRDKKPPNMAGLSQAEQDALRGEMSAVQRALDYIIEASTIQHFMPNATMTPADRTRLENMWARHPGKHLWEIPQRELMAASPAGYREMQKLERLRNPSYMPMVARGTHFIAAYKKLPNGARGELVGMVAYTPNNLMQRMRGFSNPEADAINQLRAEFPDNKYVVTTTGRQFTHDAQARDLRNQGDFVAQYLTRLAEVSKGSKDATAIIRDMTTQIDKAQMERIFRPNNNILRAITPANESSYILDVMPQYTLSMSKIQARRFTQEAYKEATKTLSPNDQAFFDELRDYATTPSEAFGNARAAAFFWYLGGALDTAAINLTQNLNTGAFLLRDGGAKAMPIFGKLAKDLLISTDAKQLVANSLEFLNNFKATLPPDERAAIERAITDGIFTPVFTNESRSQFTVSGLSKAGFKDARGTQKKLDWLSHMAGKPMQLVEQYNRALAFMSAYRLAKLHPNVIGKANHIDNTDYKDAYGYAVGKVIDSQYLTTKEDRAYIQRFTPAAEAVTQFMSFPLKTIEQYARASGQILQGMKTSDPVLAKAGFVMLAAQIFPLIALAGIWALPFADSMKEWLETLAGVIWGSTQNFDADIREMLGGGRFAEATLRGIPHATGVASLSRRLSIDPVPAGDLMGGSAIAMLGPAAGIVEQPARAYQYYNNGDYWQMAAALMPRALGNVVRGAQLAVDEEQYTLRGNRVITPEMTHQVSNPSVRQALGFPAPEFVNAREIVTRAEEIDRATRTAGERLNKELAGYMLRMMEANQRGDTNSATEAMRRFNARMTEVMQENERRPPHLRLNPQMSAIQRRAMADFYGASSEETLIRGGRQAARPEVLRQRQMLDWRNAAN